ncbi:Peroxisome biogenesis protein 5 [Nymphaea thermarum]|nr:Peroxisome biogenesis protein 5 [Nymphaea thermarum]
MALRDLVSGGAACAVPGSSSSSSNPFGALANTILGSSSKTQERLNELPGATVAGVDAPNFGIESPLLSLPGSEDKYELPDTQGSEFLQSYRSAEHGGLGEAWNEIHRSPVQPFPHNQVGQIQPQFAEFEQIYNNAGPFPQPTWEGPPQNILSRFLHSFVESGRAGIPFRPVALPVLGLSESDKRCILDRSSIMARHFFADKSDEYINAQVTELLHSLDIDNDLRNKGHQRGKYPELEEYWTESQGASNFGTAHSADKWVTEFSQSRSHGEPDSWADAFDKQHGVNSWISQFEQNSKFLQFVSKMSRGELIVDDNQLRPAAPALSNEWAEEYNQQNAKTTSSWADQFLQNGADTWVNEFAKEQNQFGSTNDQWVDEFSKLNINDWAEEFNRGVADGAFDSTSDNWADAYDKFVEEQLAAGQQKSDSSRMIYVFSDQNPYVGHPNPLKEGQELFRKGLLSEAVLALEAEVLKNPDNSEGWRLLGITHAENDDDQQAIASMMRAMEADPNNLEVLLALGVSHTNELEQSAALKYLYRWLQQHPKYGSLVPPDQTDKLYHNDVALLFNEAVRMSPEDADVHIVLGVLYNLSREYDKAISSFQQALKLKPRDYSLWNKLGATQANSVQSADAIFAYQQALDLKPNYVRAWANMGISYANQGQYEESIRYYVRALAMNPKAENAWQYLRISLSCASRNDMLEACNSKNLDALQKEFPL